MNVPLYGMYDKSNRRIIFDPNLRDRCETVSYARIETTLEVVPAVNLSASPLSDVILTLSRIICVLVPPFISYAVRRQAEQLELVTLVQRLVSRPVFGSAFRVWMA